MERIVKTFIELVQIDSESKNEGKLHEYLYRVFTELGLEVYEDSSKEVTGLGANNLVAKLNGTLDKEALLFSCHTDTVKPGNGIEVEIKEGVLYSKGETILAADDKAGIATMIEVIKQIKENHIETGLIEFVLCPGEEIGLIGSQNLDFNLIESKRGFVLDSAGKIGHVTVGSPSLYMYDVHLTGKAAHAGLEPEKGISCVDVLLEATKGLEFGRLDDETTANIGVIQGGEATNVVMDKMLIKGEVRSINDSKATLLINKIEDSFRMAASKYGAGIEFIKDKKATGFKIGDDAQVIQLLKKAASQINLEIVPEVSGGGSDANVFNANGIEVVNLSIGYDKIHTVDENIKIEDMNQLVELVLQIVKAA